MDNKTLDIPSPTLLKSISGRGIVKLAAFTYNGSDHFHVLALSSTGQ